AVARESSGDQRPAEHQQQDDDECEHRSSCRSLNPAVGVSPSSGDLQGTLWPSGAAPTRSYYAITQVFVAARRPPELKAFFANEMCTDLFRHIAQFGGVPGSG